MPHVATLQGRDKDDHHGQRLGVRGARTDHGDAGSPGVLHRPLFGMAKRIDRKREQAHPAIHPQGGVLQGLSTRQIEADTAQAE